MSEAWAYIAHKDDHWAGIVAADIGAKGLKEFFGDFAGFAITPVPDRATYLKTIEAMKCWHDHPEYRAKHPNKDGA